MTTVERLKRDLLLIGVTPYAAKTIPIAVLELKELLAEIDRLRAALAAK